ncbi:MAG TPA: small multi-drug export protein [Symbiobacteriaceae bacterium]|nr:small multi-drug export protein [Symbiobacteriaceae bacterium]
MLPTNPALSMLATLAVSMVPILELRAGIPLGVALGLPTGVATALGIIGNILQIQVAVIAVAWGYRQCARLPRVQRWLDKTEAQIIRHKGLIRRWGWLGLVAFVLLPLPGTGVWGGVVLSRLLGLAAAPIWLGLSVGIVISGLLFGLGTHGVVAVVTWLR